LKTFTSYGILLVIGIFYVLFVFFYSIDDTKWDFFISSVNSLLVGGGGLFCKPTGRFWLIPSNDSKIFIYGPSFRFSFYEF